MMSTNTAMMVARAIVSSRLDYCNSVLAGMSDANFKKLERVQYSLARVVTGMPVSPATIWYQFLPNCIGYQSAPGSLSRSQWRSSRSDRRGSHPTLLNSSKMLFHQGHYGRQQVANVLWKNLELFYFTVRGRFSILQPKHGTLYQTMSGWLINLKPSNHI